MNKLKYVGCAGDGYSVVAGNTLYNELNPSGIEYLMIQEKCDSIINVSLIFDDCNANMNCAPFIPNVISTYQDGINDVFRFFYPDSCEVVLFRITIFDRWGEELYSSADPFFTWNGIFNDQPMQPGVFTYVAELWFQNALKPLNITGDLTILR